MAYTTEDIKNLFEQAEKMGATHLIIGTDTFKWEDFPVFVMPGQDARKRAPVGNMTIFCECYKISLGWETQSKERRANNWD